MVGREAAAALEALAALDLEDAEDPYFIPSGGEKSMAGGGGGGGEATDSREGSSIHRVGTSRRISEGGTPVERLQRQVWE